MAMKYATSWTSYALVYKVTIHIFWSKWNLERLCHFHTTLHYQISSILSFIWCSYEVWVISDLWKTKTKLAQFPSILNSIHIEREFYLLNPKPNLAPYASFPFRVCQSVSLHTVLRHSHVMALVFLQDKMRKL